MVEALVLNVSDLVGAVDAADAAVVVGELMELATLELLLCWGNGGLLVKTAVLPTAEAATAGVTFEIWVSDTDTDVVIGADTDTFWAEDEVVETTAEAATAAILDEAS